jgi:hypothetical protein
MESPFREAFATLVTANAPESLLEAVGAEALFKSSSPFMLARHAHQRIAGR